MRYDFSYYILDRIAYKKPDAATKLFNADVSGRLCYIGFLQAGRRAYLNVVLASDPYRFQSVHTSTVSDWRESKNGSQMEIDTVHARYYLRRATLEEIKSGLEHLRIRPMTVPISPYGVFRI